MSQLKFSLKIWNNISIGGPGPLGPPPGYALDTNLAQTHVLLCRICDYEALWHNDGRVDLKSWIFVSSVIIIDAWQMDQNLNRENKWI